ncbi:MAG: hypothetical protein CM15mP127_06740 [Gammaproteobacteria bacterium]|nr:MAG: hypothetical protein CM15mP127_06740 [Gammaproteobacteria bacterium]
MTEPLSGILSLVQKRSEVIPLDKDNDGVFEQRLVVANNLQNPAGVAYFKGDLYFAEMDTIWIIKNIDEWLDSNSKDLT